MSISSTRSWQASMYWKWGHPLPRS